MVANATCSCIVKVLLRLLRILLKYLIQYLSSLSSRRVISRMRTGTDVGGKKPNSVMTRVTYLMGVRS